MRTLHVLCVVSPLAFCAAAQSQTTRYVAPCGDDAWTGLSQTCSAPDGPKRTIQAAINASVSGDTVLAAAGTYSEHVDFGGRNITVQGAGVDQTVIDGQNTGVGVRFTHGETAAAVLRDLTVRRGAFTPAISPAGGNVYVTDASPTLINCNITEGNGTSEPVTVSGGVTLLGSSSTLLNCRITSNDAQDVGGIIAFGTGIHLVNCYLTRNGGDVAAVQVGGSATLVNCTLAHNVSNTVCVQLSPGTALTVTNCILWGNHGHYEIDPGANTPTVTYSDIDGGYVGTGNIDADPLLNGLEVPRNSPCVDRGDNSVFSTYGDIVGKPRAITLTGSVAPAPSPGPQIDMGCFEVQQCLANCDQSTTPPILNVNDFICFQQQFAAGCP